MQIKLLMWLGIKVTLTGTFLKIRWAFKCSLITFPFRLFWISQISFCWWRALRLCKKLRKNFTLTVSILKRFDGSFHLILLEDFAQRLSILLCLWFRGLLLLFWDASLYFVLALCFSKEFLAMTDLAFLCLLFSFWSWIALFAENQLGDQNRKHSV